MEELNLEDLKQEAAELGIEFSDRIGAKTLKERIDAFYEKEANTADLVKVDDTEAEDEIELVKVTETKAAAAVVEAGWLEKSIDEIREGLMDNPKLMHKIITKKIDIESRETRIVRLTMVDKREASTATDAYFNNGTLATRVPLDTWVEMPNGLIEQAEIAKAVIHVESNGVTLPKLTKKYVIDYKEK